jgi:hypothetical protein
MLHPIYVAIVLLTQTFILSLPLYAAEEIQACQQEKHTAVIACLETLLKKSQIQYKSLSKLVAQQMVELDAATLRNEAVKAYASSEQSFKSFMYKDCAWYAAAALGGLTGIQNQLICEITLTRMRIKELRAQLGH